MSSSAKSTQFTSALLAAGLVVLGAWMGVEIVRLWQQESKEEQEFIDKIEEKK